MISTAGSSQTMNCRDKLANCKDYGTGVCTDPQYNQWANDNCPAFCRRCGAGGMVTGGGTVSGGSGGMQSGTCRDAISNCTAYGDGACVGQYVEWARKNCAHFCGLCGTTSTGGQIVIPGGMTGTGGTGSGTMPGGFTGSGQCRDAIQNCAAYG